MFFIIIKSCFLQYNCNKVKGGFTAVFKSKIEMLFFYAVFFNSIFFRAISDKICNKKKSSNDAVFLE